MGRVWDDRGRRRVMYTLGEVPRGAVGSLLDAAEVVDDDVERKEDDTMQLSGKILDLAPPLCKIQSISVQILLRPSIHSYRPTRAEPRLLDRPCWTLSILRRLSPTLVNTSPTQGASSSNHAQTTLPRTSTLLLEFPPSGLRQLQ